MLLQYEGGEPCSICGHVMLPPGLAPHDSCMPATIISGFLYLGSYDTASRQDLLKAMGITHVLNVSWAGQGLEHQQGPCCGALGCQQDNQQQGDRAPWEAGCSGGALGRGHDAPLTAPHMLPQPLQTVPSCPALYKNTFTYHTVEHAPPEFEECFHFLGGLGLLAAQTPAAPLGLAACSRARGICTALHS